MNTRSFAGLLLAALAFLSLPVLAGELAWLDGVGSQRLEVHVDAREERLLGDREAAGRARVPPAATPRQQVASPRARFADFHGLFS